LTVVCFQTKIIQSYLKDQREQLHTEFTQNWHWALLRTKKQESENNPEMEMGSRSVAKRASPGAKEVGLTVNNSGDTSLGLVILC
jgi:hypothetical protein